MNKLEKANLSEKLFIFCFYEKTDLTKTTWLLLSGFELAVRDLQFANRFENLRMSFCIFP